MSAPETRAGNVVPFPDRATGKKAPPPFDPSNPAHQEAWATIWTLGLAEKASKESLYD